MTEEEWLACDDFDAMAQHLINANPGGRCVVNGRPGRKVLLACCALAGCIAQSDPDEQVTAALELAERNAEEEVSDADRQEMRERISRHRVRLSSHSTRMAGTAAFFALGDIPNSLRMTAQTALRATEGEAEERLLQIAILRDIFGNPFRTATLGLAWRTDTAVSIARGMYESWDFSAMPILADALQDAGCDSDDVLNHCRDAHATHVRGCWVVDLVLGKG